jgi:hypothetical protein
LIKEVESKDLGTVLARGLMQPINNARYFFLTLGQMIDQDVNLTFRLKGARSGYPKWIDYNRGKGVGYKGPNSTTRYPSGAWKRRRGTDDAKRRQYNETSQMLQASGQFRKSFKTLRVTKDYLLYGSNLTVKGKKIGAKIIEDPKRPVLYVTMADRIKYSYMFKKFIDKGIKF